MLLLCNPDGSLSKDMLFLNPYDKEQRKKFVSNEAREMVEVMLWMLNRCRFTHEGILTDFLSLTYEELK